MPIQDRRFYIQKHNADQEGIAKAHKQQQEGTTTYNGDLNAFARTEQSNAKVRGGRY